MSSQDSARGDKDVDDKQGKIDRSEATTKRFVVALLLICCVACSYLVLSHMGRDDIFIPHVVHDSVTRGKTGASAAGAHIAVHDEHGHASSTNLDSATHQTNIGQPSIEEQIDPIIDLKDSAVGRKIAWTGCLYELPNPSLPAVPSLNSQGKRRINENVPGYDYNRRHIVPPPAGPVTLVCCNTTKGPLNIEVHPTWAPNGAERFLHMVNSGFFATEVGLFRALNNFLVQFGLPGDPAVLRKYHSMGNLIDDPPWLPLGPPGREINGTTRFQKGYLAYAGAGKNSRGTQLIMAFQDNLYLGGGSPWEVPFAQLFGARSFETLGKIYTGYGEKPSQGKIMNRGVAYLREEFPLLDYINNCAVTRENVPWSYVHSFS